MRQIASAMKLAGNDVNEGGTFGMVTGVRGPRIMQVGAKSLF